MTGGDVYVVGAAGRIGGLIASMNQGPWSVHAVTRRHDPVGLHEPGPAAPILLCVRNDDLPLVLAGIHQTRHPDLVFVQNGLIWPHLAELGHGDATGGVLYVAVTTPGGAPVPGGTSVFSGPWADRIAALLQHHGVAAAAVDRATFADEVALKLAWICATGLLGEVHGASVGGLLANHRPALLALLAELHPLLAPGLPFATFSGRLLDYSAAIPHFPARLKERRWRNDAIAAAARARGLALPLHAALLDRLDHPAEIPPGAG